MLSISLFMPFKVIETKYVFNRLCYAVLGAAISP